MRTIRLYAAQTMGNGQEIQLDAVPSHHLAIVLRAKPGQVVELFNGDGNRYSARVSAISKKCVTVAIDDCVATNNESPLHVELGIGISKGDRFDFVLQKSTELGVTAITPLITERTEVRLDAERVEKKLEHWRQVVISACEQSERNVIPTVNTLHKFADWVGSCDAEQKFVLHHRAEQSPAGSARPQKVALLIGPEGGLAADEIMAAEKSGFTPWCLGPRVLRTETAPLVAITALQWLWGDFG